MQEAEWMMGPSTRTDDESAVASRQHSSRVLPFPLLRSCQGPLVGSSAEGARPRSPAAAGCIRRATDQREKNEVLPHLKRLPGSPAQYVDDKLSSVVRTHGLRRHSANQPGCGAAQHMSRRIDKSSDTQHNHNSQRRPFLCSTGT